MQGSFERIGEIAVGASVPADYLQTAEQHAAEGCYVLAMAHRCPLVISAFAFAQSADCLAALVNHSLAHAIGGASVLHPFAALQQHIAGQHCGWSPSASLLSCGA